MKTKLLIIVETGYACGLFTIIESISQALSHRGLFFSNDNFDREYSRLLSHIERYAKLFDITFEELLDIQIVDFVRCTNRYIDQDGTLRKKNLVK